MARLTRDDWAGAALGALSTGGVAAVAVEPLAASLGATKGSFYWHFASRADLVTAALELWLDRHTERVIAEVEAGAAEPAERLSLLFATVFGRAQPPPDLALLGALEDPVVRSAVERATERRVAYIEGLLRATGLSAAAARRRAVFAYAAYVGHLQLRATHPELLDRSVGSLRRYREEVVATMLAR